MQITHLTTQITRILFSLSLWLLDPCTASHAALETTKALTILVPIMYEGCVIGWTYIIGGGVAGGIAGGAAGGAAAGGTAAGTGTAAGGTAAATGGGGAATGTAAAGSLLGPILIGLVIGAVVIGGIAYLMNKPQKVNIPYKDESGNKVPWAGAKLSKAEKDRMLSQKGNISVTCFHVSCKSDHPKNRAKSWNAIGFVLYSYKGKQRWSMNHVRCRSGYVVLISSDKVIKAQKKESLHNTAFKMIFGLYPSQLRYTLIGGGFSVQRGQCVFNSGSFNAGFAERDSVHFGTRVMNPLEQKYIAYTTKNWIENRQQNTDVSTVPKDGGDILCVHPDYVKTEDGKKMINED